jgi:hypothetical protein|tara:strand:+ start:1551 stop:1706 length:156 start_codon:yes stop_codon:yes gene_type:complete
MIGFTTTATISELIDKRPMRRRKTRTKKNKMPFTGRLRAVQKLLPTRRIKY